MNSSLQSAKQFQKQSNQGSIVMHPAAQPGGRNSGGSQLIANDSNKVVADSDSQLNQS